MDNLTAHRNLIFQQIIHQAGHRIAFRAPYNPVDGPIEYYFNHVQNCLTLVMYRIRTLDDVRSEVRKTLCNTSLFRPFFLFCGYPDN